MDQTCLLRFLGDDFFCVVLYAMSAMKLLLECELIAARGFFLIIL